MNQQQFDQVTQSLTQLEALDVKTKINEVYASISNIKEAQEQSISGLHLPACAIHVKRHQTCKFPKQLDSKKRTGLWVPR